MNLNVSYTPKQFTLKGLKGISDKTLEMHFKLYEDTSTRRIDSRPESQSSCEQRLLARAPVPAGAAN